MPRAPKAAKEPVAEAVEEIQPVEEVEEVVKTEPAERSVTFVLDPQADEDDAAADDDDEDEDLEFDPDELTTAVGQLTQLMMTNDGEAITDVLAGVRDAIDKQNKILYRGLQLLETRLR